MVGGAVGVSSCEDQKGGPANVSKIRGGGERKGTASPVEPDESPGSATPEDLVVMREMLGVFGLGGRYR